MNHCITIRRQNCLFRVNEQVVILVHKARVLSSTKTVRCCSSSDVEHVAIFVAFGEQFIIIRLIGALGVCYGHISLSEAATRSNYLF